MSDKGQKDLLANAYRTERIFNDENRRKITLPETEKDIKLKDIRNLDQISPRKMR